MSDEQKILDALEELRVLLDDASGAYEHHQELVHREGELLQAGQYPGLDQQIRAAYMAWRERIETAERMMLDIRRRCEAAGIPLRGPGSGSA